MKYAFIEEQRTQHSVSRLCRILEVSTAGFYESRHRAPSARSLEDSELAESVIRAHRESRSTYGRPRIHAELRAQGCRVGQKRVPRLMKAAGISGVQRRRYRKTTDSTHDFPIAPNTLARRFDVTKIETTERVWAGDTRTSQHTKAGSILRWSWIWYRAASSAGRCGRPWNVRWSSTRCVLRSRTSAPERRHFFIPIAAANTRAPSFARSLQPTV